MSKKILFFGDVGIDDTVALIYAYLKEELEIVGIVADYGNVPREQTIENVYYLINQVNPSTNIRVIGGAIRPLTGEAPVFYPDIHGKYGLGPINPGNSIGEIENFFEIANIIETYQNELIIVNTGRLTSLATMFILFAELMKSVKSYYVMGGAFWVPGNVTAVSEANFHADPIAVKIVLEFANNLTIIPLNVTNRAIVTPEMVDYIHSKGKAPIIKPMLDHYYRFYKNRNPSIHGSPVHDAITLMAVNNDIFSYQHLPVQIVQTEGVARGQSIVDIRPYIPFPQNAKIHKIAFDFDYHKFYIEFMTTLSG
ncbi:nucleoside hydrolase [Risungbinella massiliensis]|uniref:nucleoside hydrolase n=1 Tax=Risungbinella massiliensis TaxID=1329796 RepID=UPI0005CBE042|nr:nucleoside hydrolase [Risungbinella massiliensis]